MARVRLSFTGRDHVPDDRSQTILTQIDGNAAGPDSDTTDKQLDDTGLLGRKQRRPELVEPAKGRDDCSFVCFRDFVSNGVDRASRDLWSPDHSPDLAYDRILDHPCGQTLDGRRIRRWSAFDQVHRGIVAVEPRRLLGGRRRHRRAAICEDDPLQQRRCLATGMGCPDVAVLLQDAMDLVP